MITGPELLMSMPDLLDPPDPSGLDSVVDQVNQLSLTYENFIAVSHILRHLLMESHTELARGILASGQWQFVASTLKPSYTADFLVCDVIIRCKDGNKAELMEFLRQHHDLRLDLQLYAISLLDNSVQLREILLSTFGRVCQQEIVDSRDYVELKMSLIQRIRECEQLQ
jgi:hypothetical protein